MPANYKIAVLFDQAIYFLNSFCHLVGHQYPLSLQGEIDTLPKTMGISEESLRER